MQVCFIFYKPLQIDIYFKFKFCMSQHDKLWDVQNKKYTMSIEAWWWNMELEILATTILNHFP